MGDGRGTFADELVPMVVLMPEHRRAAMLDGGPAPPARPRTRLDALYQEAMAGFDALCFWHARPPPSRRGLATVAERLETYGSPEALRIAGEIRAALAGEDD